MLIDMHAHVIPGEFPASGPGWPRMEPADRADARVLVTERLRFTARDVFYDAERRLAAMAADGVDVELVSPMPPLLNYQMPPPAGRDLCRHINDFIVRLCESEPSRFFGLGTVPMQDPDLAAAELARIQEMGLHGIEIASNVGGVSLGDERFLNFFQEAERRALPIFVHALPVADDRIPASARATFGVGNEIGVAVTSIIDGGVAEKCPDLRLAFSHGAGGLPMMLPRAHYFWAGTWNEEPRPEGREASPNQPPVSPFEYARRFYYDTLVFDRRALRYLIDVIGPSRLLVGTDFPAMDREQPTAKTLRSMDLPAAVLESITWSNCFRFLGIDPPRVGQ
jgi:aminocarboxymuconate-semialdehyde decarboxylase